MIDKICKFLTEKIRKDNPDIDDEKAEVIEYGLQNIIGEIPKIFIVLAIALLFGIVKEVFITLLLILPYKSSSGGFHLKTHLGCLIMTIIFYCGLPVVSKYLILGNMIKYIIAILVWIFGMIMIKLYAPADTENVPILRTKDRKIKQIASYICLTVGLIIACIINNNTISNILILGSFIQTLTITKLAYKITNNKYGYEVYGT